MIAKFTTAELVAEAEREVKRRKRVNPGYVRRGRLSKRNAHRQIALMEAIAAHLKALEQHELAKDDLLSVIEAPRWR